MKHLALVLLALILLAACGTSGTTGNARPRPSIDTTVALARAIGRPILAADLKARGVPDATTTAIMTGLKKAGDDLLSGKSLADVVTDPAQWATFRAGGITSLARVITTAWPTIGQPEAELIVEGILDFLADYVRQRIAAVTSAPAYSPNDWPSGADMAAYYREEGRRDPSLRQTAEYMALIEEAMTLDGKHQTAAALRKLGRARDIAAGITDPDADRAGMIETAEWLIREFSGPQS